MSVEKILEVIELSRETGKIRKGVNETTKAIERGDAKLVAVAEDVNPPEIVMHIQPLCDEKKVMFFRVPSKLELGRAVGISVGTSAVAVVDLGEAKKKIDALKTA
ncbi:MAG: ribosomal L7Ae/L30e/S12e/Gadd45 family protein [Candidatus Aenigmatarchaeota archaeon]